MMLRKVLNHPAPLIALASSSSRCIWNIAPFVVRVPYAMNSETCAITMSHNRPVRRHEDEQADDEPRKPHKRCPVPCAA